jgi:hypothetical protein
MRGTTGQRRSRRGWAALAVVALAFLSLRPACEVWLSHWAEHGGTGHAAAHRAVTYEAAPAHEPHDALCCTRIQGVALVKPLALAVPSAEQPKSLAFPALAASALRVATPLLQALTASVIPPGSPPFYVRSARILR